MQSGGRALMWCLHLLTTALLVLAAVQSAGQASSQLVVVLTLVAVFAVIYALGAVSAARHQTGDTADTAATGTAATGNRRAGVWWLLALTVLWLSLLIFTAAGVWLAFPLYFLHLHLLPRRSGMVAVGVTAAAAITAFATHQGAFSVAMVIGPSLGAAVAIAVVEGYRALFHESEQRRRLIEQLQTTRSDLSEAQHTAGVLAERERLAREIHDTLAQGFTSIQLLLRAAERALPADPDRACGHVVQARQAAADNLAEARRFVAALTPPALQSASLAEALQQLCATTSMRHPISARFHLRGQPVPMPGAHEIAVLRIAQSAVSNTVRHARARALDLTLTYLEDHVALEVADDGAGFGPATTSPPASGEGGFGLPGMRARADALGGAVEVHSAPGAGTVLTARLPLPPSTTEDRSPDHRA